MGLLKLWKGMALGRTIQPSEFNGNMSAIEQAVNGLSQPITSDRIADGAIINGKIADLSITDAQIVSATITGAKIAAATIEAANIKDATITSAKIGLLEVNTANIDNEAVTNSKIKNLAVDSAKIADAAIETAKIKDAAITNAKIGTAAVESANIKNAAIVTAKIDDLAVTGAKIANAAIDSAQIQDAAITNAKIGNAAVDTAQIEDAAITNAKIDRAGVNKLVVGDADIATASIDGAKIKNASIGAAQIELGSIGTALIETGAIETAQIADGSITDAKIVGLAANKITAGVIDAGVITVNNLVANNITTGTLNGDRLADDAIINRMIADGAVKNPNIFADTITGDKLVADAITAREIAAATITSNEIAANTIKAANMEAGTITAISGIIADAAIDSAQIQDAAITNAKINDLDAVKITAGVVNAARISVGPTSTFGTGYDPSTKRRNFIAQPTTPYDIGDLWSGGSAGGLKKCSTARASGAYDAADWGLATNYDHTQTVIDGGVTTGASFLAARGGSAVAGMTGDDSGDTAVRIFAGSTFANRNTAPYRTLQDGTTIYRSVVGGKVILTTISPTGGISITVDGVPAFGINADGNVFATAISSSSDYISVMVTSGSFGGGLEIWDINPNVSPHVLLGRFTANPYGVSIYDNHQGTEMYPPNPRLQLNSYEAGGYYQLRYNAPVQAGLPDYNYSVFSISKLNSTFLPGFRTQIKNDPACGSPAITSSELHYSTSVSAVRSVGADEVGPYYRCNNTTKHYLPDVADLTNADKLDGYHAASVATVNTIALRNASGQIYSTGFNSTLGDTSAAASHYLVETASDGWIRPKTLANVKAEMANMLYPIGSIYISVVATNPNTLFGMGTWVAVESRCIIDKGAGFTLYSDGWLEQYGSLTSNDGAVTMVVLPKLYLSAAYWITGGAVSDVGQAPYANGWRIYGKAIDYFYVHNITNGTNAFDWSSFGYGNIPTGGGRYKWKRTA